MKVEVFGRAGLLLGAAFLVSACQGPDGTTHLGMPGSPAWMATASQATKMAHYRGQCEGYGFKAGTSQMAQCMQMEAISTKQGARAQAAEAAESFARASPKPVRHTTCNQFGRSVNCTTW